MAWAQALLLIVGLFVLGVVSVMVTARALDAQRTGVWSILFALLVQGAMSRLIQGVTDSGWSALLLGILGASVVYAALLGTTLRKGLIIAGVSSAVMLLAIVLIAAALGLPLKFNP